jgi:hypothetical protein
MSNSQVSPGDSDAIIHESIYLPDLSNAETVIIKPGQEVALPTGKQVINRSDNLPVRYDPTNFVALPQATGPVIPPLVDPNNFDHFKRYAKSKLCYNAAILDQATAVERTERIAFQVDMWSLMEHRSVEEHTKPYDDFESVPGQDIGNLFDWDDFPFEPPSTIIEGQRSKSHPLSKTQRKVACPLCDAEGKQQCSSCNGRGQILANNKTSQCSRCRGKGKIKCTKCAGSGYLLSYYEMKITWETIHSIGWYQNSFLPDKIIQRMPNKDTFFDANLHWTNDIFLTSYGNLFQTILQESPVKFEKNVQQQYQDGHFAKLKDATVMRRLKCLIRYVNISQTDYQLDGYVNKEERNKGKYLY